MTQGEGVKMDIFADLRRRKLVLQCFQDKETGALLFSGEGNWCSTFLRCSKQELYCFQKKKNWCSTVLWRSVMGMYCYNLGK